MATRSLRDLWNQVRDTLNVVRRATTPPALEALDELYKRAEATQEPEWIEFDGPWSCEEVEVDNTLLPPPPNLDDEIRQRFGATWDELDNQYTTEDMKNILDLECQLPDGLDEDGIEAWLTEQAAAAGVSESLERQRRFHQARAWMNQHPDFIAWKGNWDDAYRDLQSQGESTSFEGQGLNKPGTLVELEDGSLHLVGSINTNRGLCDDCVAFDQSAIVKRYKVLVSIELTPPVPYEPEDEHDSPEDD